MINLRLNFYIQKFELNEKMNIEVFSNCLDIYNLSNFVHEFYSYLRYFAIYNLF